MANAQFNLDQGFFAAPGWPAKWMTIGQRHPCLGPRSDGGAFDQHGGVRLGHDLHVFKYQLHGGGFPNHVMKGVAVSESLTQTGALSVRSLKVANPATAIPFWLRRGR